MTINNALENLRVKAAKLLTGCVIIIIIGCSMQYRGESKQAGHCIFYVFEIKDEETNEWNENNNHFTYGLFANEWLIAHRRCTATISWRWLINLWSAAWSIRLATDAPLFALFSSFYAFKMNHGGECPFEFTKNSRWLGHNIKSTILRFMM